MAKKIVWSKNAESDLKFILEYWNEVNQNTIYSNELLVDFENCIELIGLLPKVGRKFKNRKERFFIKGHYQIFYNETDDEIQILHLWDSRRNPDGFKLKS